MYRAEPGTNEELARSCQDLYFVQKQKIVIARFLESYRVVPATMFVFKLETINIYTLSLLIIVFNLKTKFEAGTTL